MFSKILIANRGEIALRIMRACRELGVKTVAVYSEADEGALHVKAADEAVAIGPARAQDSYLQIPKILAAAQETGAEAIHPGYGFLAENAGFAQAVVDAGLTFIGPRPEVISRMGDKVEARKIAAAAGVPVVPGSEEPVDLEGARAIAEEIGYPVLLKAVAGGGGIGMTIAKDDKGLQKAFEASARRAQSAFGDGSLYIERLFERPRHVEIQVVSDSQGNHLHFFERECSIQRRHQKVTEEAPSPLFLDGQNPELAQAMRDAAVALAKQVDYLGLGTVECLVADGAFHFIEMNTRLQVEHPCTELTCDVDLVQLQLKIAAGEPIGFGQEAVKRSGHAFELRIYAEDPDKNFFPSPGKITRLVLPEGEGVRVDAGYAEGDTVTPYYDPLIAKLIVHGEDRAQAIERALRAAEDFVVEGIKTNLPTHRAVLKTEAFARGDLSTHFFEDHL
ncbi:MAG: acetyl-CoA carboxylase biotin carboxylase subunit [Deltaproteobacteria bacterium]|nr:acetyl-CoA carboxylase biotin carboxylase subunit [Deltaproteobacteria bacterium]